MQTNLPKNLPDENNKNVLSKVEKELIQADPKIFDGVDNKKKERIIRSVVLTMHKIHIGPLPSPETLQQYSEIIPNGAERIMAMTEKQSDHRMELEKKVISGQMTQSNIGQILAFLIGIAALATAGYCIINGHDWPGAVIGGGGIVGLVTAFIQGKKGQVRSLEEKNPRYR